MRAARLRLDLILKMLLLTYKVAGKSNGDHQLMAINTRTGVQQASKFLLGSYLNLKTEWDKNLEA